MKQQVDSILAGVQKASITHGRGVLILPGNAHDDLHNYVKRALRDRFHCQCLDASEVSSFYHTVLRKGTKVVETLPTMEGRLTSYLRFASLGLLIVNRQCGWVLKDGTRYDAYISFDVSNRQAAFTFFYRGGRDCYTKLYDSNQAEKLLRRHVRTIVYDALKADLTRIAGLNSIVLQRDGRLFRSEWLGFEDAIRQLISEGLLDDDVTFGAIEVAKKFSSGLRLVQERNGTLQNPRIGAALSVSEDEGIVCTTGFPFPLRGTSGPLSVRAVEGGLNLHWVMEDLFRKSLLSWPAPGSCMRLPIDLKLCDDFLRAFAAEADEQEAIYGEDVQGTADVA